MFTWGVAAVAIDISGLSYEKLQELRTRVEERMAEYRRQYAIEHGNRRIDVGEEPVILYKKDKQQLGPVNERIDESAPEDTQLTWRASNEEVVRVSSKGVLTAVGQGDAEITCMAEDDDTIFTILPVRVRLHVSKVTLPASSVTLLLSDDSATACFSLTAMVSLDNAYCMDIIRTSDDETVATVDSNGIVQAKSLGTANIKATSAEEGSKQSATCKVKVNQAVASIVLDEKVITLNNGITRKLKASVLPENAGQQKAAWSSTNEKVTTVSSSGLITAKGSGTCTIVCSAVDGSNVSERVKVVVASAAAIELTGYADWGTAFSWEYKNITLKRTIDGITVRYDATDVYGNRMKGFGWSDLLWRRNSQSNH